MHILTNDTKIADNAQKDNILQNLERKLANNYGLVSIFGAEIEFYLDSNTDINIDALEKLIGLRIKAEKGKNQYEIELQPNKNASQYAQNIINMRAKIISNAKLLGMNANFSPKPHAQDYGSSMHIHINFENDNEDIEKYAQILCHYCRDYINYFLQNKADYARLDPNFMAPTHICWGGNNRTALIRIPDAYPRRLEHRLPSSDANPHLVLRAILESIILGLENPHLITKIGKIHGNAFDKQYNLQKIIY